MSLLQDRAASLADALDRHADAGQVLINTQLAINTQIRLLAEAVDQTEAQLQAQAARLAQPPAPTGVWGPGPFSGLRWWSGVAWRGIAADAFNAFVSGPRGGRKVDLVQLFSPANPPLAHDWAMIAGGPGEDPSKLDGTLTTTRGGKQAALIWTDPVIAGLPVIYSLRTVPTGASSNEGGRNPAVWDDIAKGGFDGVFTMLGRRFGYLDDRHRRTALMVLEPAWEMSGDWYPWSIAGVLSDNRWCYQVFPDAWARIVDGIRAGYLRETGRNCPYLFLFRPGRLVLGAGVRLDRYLPPSGTWDCLGITCHDNAPWCCAEAPRACWTPAVGKAGVVQMEGLELLAEQAERYKKPIVIAEWAGYPPESQNYKSSPQGEFFVQAMWDFFSEHTHLVAAECFFDRGETTFISRPDWSASKAYRRLWGRADGG